MSEHRPINRYPEGPYDSYAGEWKDRWVNDYVKRTADKQNIVDGTTHALAGAASVFVEGMDLPFDYLARKIDGKERSVTPLQGYFARTRRSTRDLFADPGVASTVATAFRYPGDIGMDLLDGGIANTHMSA